MDLTVKTDTRGDRDNLRYGQLERSSIPKYRLAGKSRVVGLSRAFRIARDSGSFREIVAVGADSSQRYLRNSLHSPIREPDSSITTADADDQLDLIRSQSDYVSLRQGKRRKLSGQSELRPFSILDGSTKLDETSSSSDEGEHREPSDNDNFTEFREDAVHKRQRDLMGETSQDPDNLDSWLSLVAHQEAIVLSYTVQSRRMTPDQHRILSKLRIGVYEDALSKATLSETREQLVIGLMQEGAKLWDRQQQAAQWDKTLAAYMSLRLSMIRLDFLLTNAWSFSYSECSDYVHTLLQSRDQGTRNVIDTIYLLLRATFLMKQAGYDEKATAVWQALIEFNLFRPNDTASGTTFEEFWDSEVARVGEMNAKGWKRSNVEVLPSGMLYNVSPRSPSPAARSFSAWAAKERTAATRKQSARTNEATDDPFEVVLFDDVKAFLFQLASRAEEEHLLNGFLLFAGLPQMQFSGIDRINDQFLCHVRGMAEGPLGTLRAVLPQSGAADTLSLFASRKATTWAFCGVDFEHQPVQLAVNALLQILTVMADHEVFAEYAIALSLVTKPEETRKLAKRTLKAAPNSGRLYNSFALAECRSGRYESAANVWTTAIKMLKTFSSQALLHHAWLWECGRSNLPHEADKVIRSMAECIRLQDTCGSKSSSVSSSVEDTLRAQLSRAYTNWELSDVVVYTDLLALTLYHNSAADLSTALQIYTSVLDMESLKHIPSLPTSVLNAIETLHNHRIQLITSSIEQNRPFRPSTISSILAQSAALFPKNAFFARIQQDFSIKHGALDRLHSLLSPSHTPPLPDQTPPPLLSALLALRAEHLRLKTQSQAGVTITTEHALRATYQRVTGPDCDTRSCAAIHVSRLAWELSLLRAHVESSISPTGGSGTTGGKGHTMRRAARELKQRAANVKTAFRAAVSACPWVKEMYLLYFDPVLEGLVDDWRETYESMLERGLRVRIDMEF
jgi:hypothetical protein